MRHLLRHGHGRQIPVLVAAVLLFISGAYMLVVPRENWIGLFPSSSTSASSSRPSYTTAPHTIAPLPGARAPPDLQRILDDLHANFTTEYARHSSSPSPEPVYAGPYLTPTQRRRYARLRSGKYMVTTITRQVSSQLPDLLNMVAVLAHFLGPDALSFSILEGPSDDPTPHILNNVLRPLLATLGVPVSAVRIETDAPKIEWDKNNRIEALASLRNQALEPLWSARTSSSTVGDGVSAVVFLNDVFLHASDVLELLDQHVRSSASITTAWDWMTRDPAYFYDVWVARSIETGDLFYPIPGSEWHPSSDILSDSPASRAAFESLRPFQVFSSWNALAVLDPTPFRQHGVRFRRGGKGECAASECLLICSDFWRAGYGRVQVVPSVQLAYGRDVAVQTAHRLREDTVRLGWKGGVTPVQSPLEWKKRPPHKVRCNPWPEVYGLSANVWEKTTWVPPFRA